MPPGEKNQVDFVDDIRVCNVEVVFKQVHAQVPVYLVDSQLQTSRFDCLCQARQQSLGQESTHILVNNLLSLSKGRTSKMRCNLRCRIVHKLSILPKHVLRAGAALLLLRVRAAAVGLTALRRL